MMFKEHLGSPAISWQVAGWQRLYSFSQWLEWARRLPVYLEQEDSSTRRLVMRNYVKGPVWQAGHPWWLFNSQDSEELVRMVEERYARL